MTDEDERELQAELARLQQEHRDLDAAIDALHQSPAPDLLRFSVGIEHVEDLWDDLVRALDQP